MRDLQTHVFDRHMDIGLQAAQRDVSSEEREIASRIASAMDGVRPKPRANSWLVAATVLVGAGVTAAVAWSIRDAGQGPAEPASHREVSAPALGARPDGTWPVVVDRRAGLRWRSAAGEAAQVADVVAGLAAMPGASTGDPVKVVVVPEEGATFADVVATVDALNAAGFTRIGIEGVTATGIMPVFVPERPGAAPEDLATARYAVPFASESFRGPVVRVDEAGRAWLRAGTATRAEGPMGAEALAVALSRLGSPPVDGDAPGAGVGSGGGAVPGPGSAPGPAESPGVDDYFSGSSQARDAKPSAGGGSPRRGGVGVSGGQAPGIGGVGAAVPRASGPVSGGAFGAGGGGPTTGIGGGAVATLRATAHLRIPGQTPWPQALPAFRACAAAGFDRIQVEVRRADRSGGVR